MSLHEYVCPCGTVFYRDRDNGKFCSTSCKALDQQASYTDRLLALLADGASQKKAARELGITKNAVQMKMRRLRKNGLWPPTEYQEMPASDYTIVKVERNIMAYWKPVIFKQQYGPTYQRRLTDDEKAKMGGDVVVYFFGEMENGKWKLIERAPKQDW